jgi:DNA repair exonuclease SbcCD ATPase subunit
MVHVTETFTSDTIEIKRERPSKLTVTKNGTQIKGISQKEVDQLLGMDAFQFLVSVYLPQKRKKSFYWMNDTERTELLSLIAGLEVLDGCLESAKKQKEESQAKVQWFEGSLMVLKQQLQTLPEELKTLKTKRFECQMLEGDAKEAVFKAELSFKTYSNNLKIALDALLKSKEDDFLDEATQMRLEIATIQGKLNALNQSLQNLPQIEQSFFDDYQKAIDAHKVIQRKNAQSDAIFVCNRNAEQEIYASTKIIEALRQGKCEKCKQPLLSGSIEAEISYHEKDIAEYKAAIQMVPELINERDLLLEITKAQDALNTRKAELSVLPDRIKSDIFHVTEQVKQKKLAYQSRERIYEHEKKNEMMSYSMKIKELEREVEQAKHTLAKCQQSYESASQSYKSVQDTLVLVESQIEDYEKDLVDWQMKYDQSLDLIELFGAKGFRSVCYDGLVCKISEKANERLLMMTENVYSTHLEQTAQDSKGNQKLVLRPILLKNGIEVPKDDLSGGAEARVALAYDIAVSETISHNLPLLLDETLEGLDAVGKSEAMILLEDISKHRTVIVIDHASEFKAQFTHVHKVIYERGESRLEVA